ncbi:tetraspanin-33-like isoform X2 [Patiria miniata]|uniref:Tetraspanin n=1 Tax=Patiria miniata TaxID=46514 RepID=A0A914B400_PATMI|nr:tetraspanin-33-like isoform X2 [Patiria miniata]
MNEGRDLAKTHINPCIKYTLFVLNFLLWVFSIVLIIIGIWALIERQNTVHIQSYLDVFTESSIVLIVVGSVCFILGFTGFLGALRENCCLLMFFYLFMFLIFILEVVAGILAFVYSGSFYTTVDEIVERSIAQYRTDLDLTNFIDFAQRTLECCGGDKGYNDWSLNRYFNCNETNPSPERCGVPYSCCVETKDANGGSEIINTQCGFGTQNMVPADVSGQIYTAGCVDKFLVYVNQKSYIVGLTVFGVAAFQLLVMLLAFLLCRQIEQECSRYHECKKRGINNFA